MGQWGSVWHKSRLESRDFYRKYGMRTQKYGIRTPPSMPYEPFLLGVGMVFKLFWGQKGIPKNVSSQVLGEFSPELFWAGFRLKPFIL